MAVDQVSAERLDFSERVYGFSKQAGVRARMRKAIDAVCNDSTAGQCALYKRRDQMTLDDKLAIIAAVVDECRCPNEPIGPRCEDFLTVDAGTRRYAALKVAVAKYTNIPLLEVHLADAREAQDVLTPIGGELREKSRDDSCVPSVPAKSATHAWKRSGNGWHLTFDSETGHFENLKGLKMVAQLISQAANQRGIPAQQLDGTGGEADTLERKRAKRFYHACSVDRGDGSEFERNQLAAERAGCRLSQTPEGETDSDDAGQAEMAADPTLQTPEEILRCVDALEDGIARVRADTDIPEVERHVKLEQFERELEKYRRKQRIIESGKYTSTGSQKLGVKNPKQAAMNRVNGSLTRLREALRRGGCPSLADHLDDSIQATGDSGYAYRPQSFIPWEVEL